MRHELKRHAALVKSVLIYYLSNLSLAKAAKGESSILGSSFFFLFMYALTSLYDALLFSPSLRLLKEESFSLWPHLQTKVLPSPSPTSFSFLWQTGQRALVTIDKPFLYPHSLSGHTSIVPLLPLTCKRFFPQSGHFSWVTLSCLKTASLVFISLIIFSVYFLISFMKAFLSRWPLAMESSFFSHLAVSAGVLRSSGTKLSSCIPLDVIMRFLPLFSTKNDFWIFSIMSALVATVPMPPVSVSIFAKSFSLLETYFAGFSMAPSSVPSVNLDGGEVLPSVLAHRSIGRASPFLRLGNIWLVYSSGPSPSS